MSGGVTIVIEEGDPKGLIERLRRFVRRGERDTHRSERRFADELLETIRENIVRQDLVQTGEYRDSWYVTSDDEGRSVQTDHPAARRLNDGFVGTDSLGRHYDQAPRDHVRNSVEEVSRRWADHLNGKVESWWR